MKTRRFILTAVLPFLMIAAQPADALAAPAVAKDYKVGDRLEAHDSGMNSKYKNVTWDDLMPKDWDPMADVKKLDFSKLKDSDPRAMDALRKLREAWNNAPIAPAMDGARIRIPGFIVPLEMAQHRITEFLLVPYFGGCIHVPPPPANQIIHVFPAQPLQKSMQSMDAVWISGTLEISPSDTGMGSASYKMKAEIVEPYKE